MKKNSNLSSRKSILLIVILVGLISPVMAQTDTTKPQTDTTRPVKLDTTNLTFQDTVKAIQAYIALRNEALKEKKKIKNEFILYVGGNSNDLNLSADKFEATPSLGYHLQVSYKQGRFFYWQVGARYNSAHYNFVSKSSSTDTGKLAVSDIAVPITVGVNLLSFVNRFFALRAFVSAVPSYTVKVGDNNLNFTKDNVNSFVFYGQAGLGVNVAFLFIDVGYNYGFANLLKNYDSKPGQVFVSLGFRF